MINQKYEDKMCGNGPSLSSVFQDDHELKTVARNVQVRENTSLDTLKWHRIV